MSVLVLLLACQGPGIVEEEGEIDVAAPYDRVALDLDAGAILLDGEEGSASRLSWVLASRDGKARLEQAVQGDTLRVVGRCPQRGPCTTSVRLSLPRDVVVEAVTGAGNVAVWDLRREVVVETGAGHVDLRVLSDDVDAWTGAGDILGRGLRSLAVVAETGSGSVDLAWDVAPLDALATSGAGDVLLDVPTGAYDLDATTGAGAVHVEGVRADRKADRALVAETGAGDVWVTGR